MQTLNVVGKLKQLRANELIIVNNGSTDETKIRLENWRNNYDGECILLHESTKGLSRARNLGWKEANGEIVVFTDDDCHPDNSFLMNVIKCFNNDNLAYLGGRILLGNDKDYPISIQLREFRLDIHPYTFLPAGLIQGANLSIRRSALNAINGFDESLGAGTPFPCEDIEIVTRLSSMGYWGAYDPSPLVYHHHGRRSVKQVLSIKKEYDWGRGAYYAKFLRKKSMRYQCVRAWLQSQWYKHPFRTLREIHGGYKYVKLSSELLKEL